MATREFPNEWESITKETVADWLDHPCTKLLVEQLNNGHVECDRNAAFLCERAGGMQPIDVQASAMSVSAARGAYTQVINLIGKAGEYAKS